MIEHALWFSIGLPLGLALLLSAWPLAVGGASERLVARLALLTAALSAAAATLAIAAWLVAGAHPIHTTPHLWLGHGSYRFDFELVLDGDAALFFLLVQFITGLVMRFSRFYLHREPGFQRFFATVLMFEAGMGLLALAGNLDVMFAGWEMVGLSSFLLIAFYRERPSAVRNALKTYSVYRIADIGMLLAACLEGTRERTGLGLFVLLAAMGKSAQFPFSFWVARAMEGPTPSSALFYGALSVHAGAYLLLRTFHYFSDLVLVRVCVGLVGITTAVLCSMFSRAQSTIKSQIGYASVTQVGIIFVEIALGLSTLALIHIVCNALLRCYQLLISPSVVAHRLRRQATAGSARALPHPSLYQRLIPESWRPTLYVFALSEGYLKELSKGLFWAPLRRLGGVALPWQKALLMLAPGAVLVGLACGRGVLHSGPSAAAALSLLALSLSTCGLVLWRRPVRAMAWISASSLLAAAAVYATSRAHPGYAAWFYALGIALSCVCGLVGLSLATSGRGPLARYAGLAESRPAAASLALVGVLGLAGFPLLPTFFGEDLLVQATLGDRRYSSILLAAILALNGYLAVRNFAFTFFGRSDGQPGR